MRHPRRTLFQLLSVCTVVLIAGTARAGVLYSNLLGNYTSQTTSSYTVDKGGYDQATGYSSNFDFGATGAGDDYAVDPTAPTSVVNGVTSVQLTGLSFYGTVTPAPGNPSGSLGAQITAYFFPAGSSGGRPTTSISFFPTTTGTPGLQSTTLSSPSYVPASGYVIFSAALATSYNAMTGQRTSPSNGELTVTNYFGATPTVGSGSAAAFELSDTNRNLSSAPAQASSPAYMDIELDGIVASPEPSTFLLTLISGFTLAGPRRRRRRL